MSKKLKDYEKIYKECFSFDSRAYRKRLFSTLNEDDVFTVCYDQKVVGGGYVNLKTAIIKGTQVDIPFFCGIGVLKKFRGRGLATKLLTEMLCECANRGYPFVMLSTELDGFYERLGFTEIQRRRTLKLGGNENFVISDVTPSYVTETETLFAKSKNIAFLGSSQRTQNKIATYKTEKQKGIKIATSSADGFCFCDNDYITYYAVNAKNYDEVKQLFSAKVLNGKTLRVPLILARIANLEQAIKLGLTETDYSVYRINDNVVRSNRANPSAKKGVVPSEITLDMLGADNFSQDVLEYIATADRILTDSE